MIKKSKKNKRGVSVMIGYILLITFGIIVAGLVFAYLKTYVPKEEIKCPDETSIFIKNATCLEGFNLSLTLRNNGNFNLAGYFIHATTQPTQELAVTDISPYLTNQTTGPINVGSSVLFTIYKNNSFAPNDEITHYFDLTESGGIYSIEIIPIRYQGERAKKALVSCGDARVEEIRTCAT